MLSSAYKFINYWYFRYLLVTELYMVEKWERAMFHIVLLIAFALFYLFNTTVTLSLVYWLRNTILNAGPDDVILSPEYGNMHIEL